MKDFWNSRYNAEPFAYGVLPNDFLVAAAAHLKAASDILSIGEGEGRNARFLAKQGHHVVATDQSDAGMAKAQKLAEESGCSIATIVADLAEFDFEPSRYDAVVSIFCHLPSVLRKHVHEGVRASLRHGGLYILEAYSPDQLAYNTGGPKDADWLVPLDALQKEFADYEIIHSKSLVREVIEGTHHTGNAAVTQFICRKI